MTRAEYFETTQRLSEQLESDPIAIEGARFDDMNYLRYMER